ncbi:hypothetical protein [Tardiphaga sp. P9-11]|uniref:hypothetical protein n=1 Tax=Tardiphaga sp. P9-11 TaxID=2024614 RepID=UPI0011F233F2|nr:hypothetical protein [Tardiphaga sp. P9-11]KAA0069959.1 hypothetical protein CIW50_27710 [Tardiphaga sp. P9-11]
MNLKDLIAAEVVSVQRPAIEVEAAPSEPEVNVEASVSAVEEAPAAPAPARQRVVSLAPRRPARKPTPVVRKGEGTIRERARQLSLYLEEPVYDQIREIAHVERVKMHQLILEGVDLLLKKRGAPSIRELMDMTG